MEPHFNFLKRQFCFYSTLRNIVRLTRHYLSLHMAYCCKVSVTALICTITSNFNTRFWVVHSPTLVPFVITTPLLSINSSNTWSVFSVSLGVILVINFMVHRALNVYLAQIGTKYLSEKSGNMDWRRLFVKQALQYLLTLIHQFSMPNQF